jgi:DNA invertase Pin-like site-specific DNA recombinase
MILMASEEKALKKGKEIGVEIGVEKGIDIGIEKTARRMAAEGMSTADICRITGLSSRTVASFKGKKVKTTKD